MHFVVLMSKQGQRYLLYKVMMRTKCTWHILNVNTFSVPSFLILLCFLLLFSTFFQKNRLEPLYINLHEIGSWPSVKWMSLKTSPMLVCKSTVWKWLWRTVWIIRSIHDHREPRQKAETSLFGANSAWNVNAHIRTQPVTLVYRENGGFMTFLAPQSNNSQLAGALNMTKDIAR